MKNTLSIVTAAVLIILGLSSVNAAKLPLDLKGVMGNAENLQNANESNVVKVHKRHFCRKKRGWRFKKMYHRRGKHICRYVRKGRKTKRRRSAKSAWRLCRKKYGRRLVRARWRGSKALCTYRKR